MSKKNLVIDIGREAVRAGVFLAGRVEPVTVHSQPVTAEGGVKQALSALLLPLAGKRGFKGFDKVAVGIPPEDLSIRIVELPFEDRKKIIEALPFELAGFLHVEVDDVVADAVQLGESKVMAVAVEKRVLRGYLDALSALGIDPVWMGPGLFAMPVLMNELFGTEGCRAVLSPGVFAVVQDGMPRLLKHARRLDNVGLGVAFLDAEGITVEELHFSGWENDREALQEMFGGAHLVPLDLPGSIAPEAAEALALSMLLDKGLAGTIVNFRRGEFEYTKERAAFRRRLRLTAALCASLLVLVGADFYARYRGLTGELEAYRQSLRASYQELFPSESNVVDPVYQLEAKLKAVEKESASLGSSGKSLDVLKSVAEAVPEGLGVKIDEFSLADGRVAVRGEAPAFNAANSVKEALQKAGFKDAAMGETRAKPGGRTSFSINAAIEVK
ncbi:hypothetical protein BAC1_01627 [uncultured bacterium]|nr:hypothetical protein BAC1_01627 [uncultured bacterium]